MKPLSSLLQKRPLISCVLRRVSSYVHDQYHQIAAAQAGVGSQAAVYNAQQVRDWLLNFKGGSVKLEKDSSSGVAVLTLDHAEKRNALSGECCCCRAAHS